MKSIRMAQPKHYGVSQDRGGALVEADCKGHFAGSDMYDEAWKRPDILKVDIWSIGMESQEQTEQ